MKQKKIINFPGHNYRITANGKRLYYCCKCKQVMEEFKVGESNTYTTNEEFGIMGYIRNDNCPNCGHSTNVEWVGGRNVYSTSTLRTATVFVDEDKVTISLFFIHPWINTKVNKIAFKRSNQRITFNTKTGQTYELPQKCGNKKVLPASRQLANVTYSNFMNVPHTIIYNEELCAAVQSVVAPHIEEPLNLIELKLANRLPQLSYKQLKAIAVENGIFYNTSMSKVFRKTHKQQDASEFVDRVCKNIKIENNKTNRKLMLDGNFNTIKLAMDMGLRDVNNIRTVVSAIHKMMYDYELRNNRNYYMTTLINGDVIAFMNDVVHLKGEQVAVKILTDAVRVNADDDYYPFATPRTHYACEVPTLFNIAIIWKQISGLVDDSRKKKYLKGNLESINSKLIKDIEKFRQRDIHEPFDYTEVERKFEYNIDKYSFKLAKNKAEMIECGTEMHICVGQKAYTDNAAIKQVFIIFVRENNKYKACIELDSKHRLVQVKTFANCFASGDLAEAVTEWTELHPEIEAENCYDYMHMNKSVSPVNEAEQARRIEAALEAFN